jgi:ribosomal protein S18 acetylase RimI-like enzyme
MEADVPRAKALHELRRRDPFAPQLEHHRRAALEGRHRGLADPCGRDEEGERPGGHAGEDARDPRPDARHSPSVLAGTCSVGDVSQRRAMGEEPAVRPATPADVPALSALAKRTWADAFGHSVSAADVAAELASSRSEAFFHAALQTDVILVAEAGGELVGYVELGGVDIAGVDAGPEDVAVRRLYVDGPWQGRGMGRRLLEAVLAHLRAARAPRVYVQVWEENRAALRLYERAGFRTVATTTFTLGAGTVAEDLVMVRTAAARR